MIKLISYGIEKYFEGFDLKFASNNLKSLEILDENYSKTNYTEKFF